MKEFLTSKWTGKWIVALEQQDWEHATYMAFDDVAGLIELAQIGNLELHPWSSRPNREMEELAKCPAHGCFTIVPRSTFFPCAGFLLSGDGNFEVKFIVTQKA